MEKETTNNGLSGNFYMKHTVQRKLLLIKTLRQRDNRAQVLQHERRRGYQQKSNKANE